jgi:hypothetical protein
MTNRMLRRSIALVVVALAAAAAGGGCSSSGSVSSWQRGVERYVADKGGDPTVLRDVTLAGDRRGFGQIGGTDPRKSTDANGVLLGNKVVNNQPWTVYLVGVVSNEKVHEIRLAALSYLNGKPIWKLSDKNAKSLQAYQHYSEGQWKQQHPGAKEKEPGSYTTFPRDEDRFDLTQQDSHLRATHAQSGATWDVNLAGKK